MRLPADIDLSYVNNRTFAYTDALEMVEDMQRLRRASGWTCTAHNPDEHFRFQLVLWHEEADKELFTVFTIPVKTVHRTLWPSLYPNDPSVDQLRRWFFKERGGLNKIAALINETEKAPEQLPEEASVWSRLLKDDDDLDGI